MGRAMTYRDLVRNGTAEEDLRRHLASGDMEATTIRIPRNLKDAITEEADLKGISFSAQLRMCAIDALVEKVR